MYSVHDDAHGTEHKVFYMRDPRHVVHIHPKVLRNVHCVQFDRKRADIKNELVGTHDESANPRVVLPNFPTRRSLLCLLVVVLLFARNLVIFRLAAVVRKWNIRDLTWLGVCHVHTLVRLKIRSYSYLIGYLSEWDVR